MAIASRYQGNLQVLLQTRVGPGITGISSEVVLGAALTSGTFPLNLEFLHRGGPAPRLDDLG